MRWRQGGRRRRFDFENVLGTSLEVQLTVADDEAVARAERVLLDEIDRLSAIVSTYSVNSEVMRWQQTFDCDAVVSPELAEVLDLAETWRTRSGGAFNVAAVAVAHALQARGIVDDDMLAAAQRPLWSVDRARSVARRLTTLPISLDAIAKGYIVTEVARRTVELRGVSDVLVNLGGDIQHCGATPIVVGIADPARDAENAPPLATIRIRDEAIATSGGYRRGVATDGAWHSHLIDPRTGAAASATASVSVIAPDCATADALSTAFAVLEPAESLAIAESLKGIGCLIARGDGDVITNDEWNHHALPTQR